MTKKTHKAFGLTVGLATVSAPPVFQYLAESSPITNVAITNGVLLIVGSVLGSLISDIDNPDSAVGWWCYPFFTKFYKKKPEEKPVFLWHRHFTHSFWVALLAGLFCLIPYKLSWVSLFAFSAGFALGILSHIFSDWFMSGVALFSPLSEKKFSLLHLEANPRTQTQRMVEKKQKAQKWCDIIFRYVSRVLNGLLLARGVMLWT
mgnify:CR=1 FL=1